MEQIELHGSQTLFRLIMFVHLIRFRFINAELSTHMISIFNQLDG